MGKRPVIRTGRALTLDKARGCAEWVGLTITGSKLSEPLLISDPAVLDYFEPRRGQFIDWQRGLVHDTPSLHDAYEVYFRGTNQTPDQVRYCLYYRPSDSQYDAAVYLPGAHDKCYRQNTHTVVRPRKDGNWHYASSAWTDFWRSTFQVIPIGSPSRPVDLLHRRFLK